jgi:hypothetical protein
MKIFIFIFTCLLPFLHIIAGISSPSISENIHQEYKVAIEVSSKFQKGMLSKEQANQILIHTFTDYSHTEGKLATITQFIQKTIGIENPILNGSSEQRGWSGSEIYAIQTEKAQEIQFFLKIFPYDSKHYLPEIFGLAIMSKVQDIDFPKICGFGQCFINENRYFLILETPVKGISIQQYFIKVGEYSIGSEERKLAFKELCEAVESCGIGLAKFHNYLPNKKQSFPKEYEVSMREDLIGAIEELVYRPKEGIEIEKLQIYVEYVLQKMKTDNHLIGIAYDDVKTIHTFYDHKTKKFSIVNPARLCLSFNHEGEVQGLPVKDVCKYFLSLNLNRFQYFLNKSQNVCRKELLTEEEVKIVTNSFELGYLQGGGILPDPIEKEYVFLQHDLFFIKNSRRDLPEPELTRIKDLINISLENIKLRLSQIN